MAARPTTRPQRAALSMGAMRPSLGEGSEVRATNPLLRVVTEAGTNIVEDLHKFVGAYCKSRYRPTITEKLATATYELFTNALGYGSVNRPVILEIVDTKSQVEVRVTNDAIPARIRMLEERLALINRDAKSTYLEEMRRSVNGGHSRSMLGLLRVVYEAGLQLELIVRDGTITVVARCPL
jgi:hypothetical protein